MTPEQISEANAKLRTATPLDTIRWALAAAPGRAIISTNYRPFEAVLLHMVVQVQPDIPVLWVDHGYNRPATYKHAEDLKKLLNLNIKAYVPKVTPASASSRSASPPVAKGAAPPPYQRSTP